MSTSEPNEPRDGPREGLSPSAIVGLIILALLLVLGGVCVVLVFTA